MYCRNCAAPIDENAQACLSCGVRRNVGGGLCSNCAKPHDPMADFCTGCGASISGRAESGDVIDNITATASTFSTQAPGNNIPEELTRCWSWGGFLLWFLWPLWNANTTVKWFTLAAFVLNFVTGGITGLALGIYFGINGNRIAARDRSFATIDAYRAVQRAWAQAGVIVLLVSVPLCAIVFLLAGFAAMIGHR